MHALSRIDLFPDFIPAAGSHDDLVLLPLVILLAIRLIPPALLAGHRAAAAEVRAGRSARVAVVALRIEEALDRS